MAESSPQLSPRKRNKKGLIVVGIVLAIVIISGVLISNLSSLLVAENNPENTVNSAPKVEITSQNLRMQSVEEHLAYVDASVHNNGGSGTVEIHASITDGINSLYGNETIYINKDESKDLTFTFSEINFSNLTDVNAYIWIELPHTDSTETHPLN
jgi:hypothetical protein